MQDSHFFEWDDLKTPLYEMDGIQNMHEITEMSMEAARAILNHSQRNCLPLIKVVLEKDIDIPKMAFRNMQMDLSYTTLGRVRA